jgi:hypothetical protein
VVTTPKIVEEHEVPLSWGWLVQKDKNLVLRRPPIWFETSPGCQQIFLQRIAAAGTTAIAKQLKELIGDGKTEPLESLASSSPADL